MNIKITDEAMTSDTTPHSTRPAGNGWTVTWLPGPALTRNQAITVMVLADTVAGGVGDHTGGGRVDTQSGHGDLRAVPPCPWRARSSSHSGVSRGQSRKAMR